MSHKNEKNSCQRLRPKGFIGVAFISRKVNFGVLRPALHGFYGHVVSDPSGSKISSPVLL